jgi:hypothetical protein
LLFAYLLFIELLFLNNVTKSDLGIYKRIVFIDPQWLTFNQATSYASYALLASHVQGTFVSRQGCFSHDF